MAAGDVLLIDDDANVLVTMQAILEDEGHRVATAQTPAAARELLRAGSFDVVLSDLRLESAGADGADGLVLLDEIKRRRPNVATIVLTGYATMDVAIRALQRGVDDFLLKPCDVEQLKQSVARGVERHRLSRRDLSLLAEASTILSSSLDFEATLSSVARVALPRFADWCTVDLVDQSVSDLDQGSPARPATEATEATYRMVATAHVDPHKERLSVELRRRYPPDPSRRHGIWHVLGTREPVLVQDAGPIQEADARDAYHLELMREVGTRSVIRVALEARGQLLGVLSFGLGRPERVFDEGDLALAQELARRSAMAIDNARLYAAAQKAIAARDEFLAAAAHELKTPMTSLRGVAQLVRRQFQAQGTVDRERLERAFATIDSQTGKLARLVNQLLDVSRIEAGQLALERTETDLAGLVRDAVAAAQATSDRHRITLDAPPSLSAVVDPLRIEQVLANLFDNAIKYSPNGGAIEVRVSAPSPGAARVVVRDRGLGIPPERREHLFDRFYHVRHGGHIEGMGLGLFISRQIVERHGGRIEVESPPDGGTEVTVTLPVD